jgi:hypothetical protein
MKASPAPDVKTNPNTPVVDLERIARTYAELKKMEIRLDPNPIEYGPKRFNHRIAQVRAMLTRLEQIFLQTSEDLHYFKRIISKRTALYELEKRDLMINDPKCRVGRSQGEREALADVQLRSDIEILQTLQLAAQDLEAMMVVIKSKRTDLKDIQGRMRDQMKLIEHDISMGARWGTSTPPPLSTAPVASVSEIDGILANVDASMGIVSDDTGAILNDVGGDEEDEEEEEDGELVEIDDSVDDPAPQVEPEPVLVFGEEDSEPEPEPEIVIPDEEGNGALPEKTAEQDDADDFLDSLGAALDSETVETSEEGSEQGIDDLIASLSED